MNSVRKNLVIVFIVVYFLFFDTHFQMPILAPFARSLGATPFLVGSIVGMYSLFNIVGNVISGHVIDSRCLKTPLTAGTVLIIISLFSYAYAPSPSALLLIRAFHGFAGGLVVPATLVYLTKTPLKRGEDSMSKRMSFYGVSIGLAALTGPPLAGMLAAWYGYAQAYLVIALLMVFPALLIIFFLKDREVPLGKNISVHEYYRHLVANGLLRLSFRMVFALMGATGTLASFLPIKSEALGASPAVTGMLFAVFAATAIAAQLIWPWLVSRFRLLNGALAGFCLLNFALLVIHFGAQMPVLFLGLAIYGIGFGLLFPALLELVAKSSRADIRGLATGIFFTFFSLGVALVPPLGGLLQQWVAVSPFFTAVMVSLILILTLPQKLRWELKKDLNL